MTRTIIAIFYLLCLSACGGSADGAVLVTSPSGNYTPTTTLAAAAIDPNAAGKTVVVTSVLSAVQSNISSATLHAWPSDRVLKIEKGGSIANTTLFRNNGNVIISGGTLAGSGRFINNTGSVTVNGSYQAFTGTGGVTGLHVIKPQWFGVIPDTGADLATGMTLLNAAMSGSPGAAVDFTEGVYKSSVAFWPAGYGIQARALGKVVIEPPDGGSNYTFVGGDREAGPFTESIRLSENMAVGGTSATVTSSSGYSAGDVVMMFSGESSNSTGDNIIPLYKQFFTITGISGNVITFSEESKYAFNTADDAKIMASTARPLVNSRIEGFHFRNNSTFLGAYLHGIVYAYNVEVVNCRFDGYSAVGYASFSDKLIYRNVDFVGYTGPSTAAGTIEVTFDNITYTPGQTSQGIGLFIEETPVKVTVLNSTIKGRVHAVNSTDATPNKQLIMRDSTIITPASSRALWVSGWANAAGFGIDLDRVTFNAPGGLNADGRKCIVDFRFADSIRITNSVWENTDADAYAIDGGNFGTTYRHFTSNRYDDSLGVHSGMLDNMNPIYATGTFTPALQFGGAAVGMTTSYAIGTYTRHGNRVFYSISLKLTAKGSSTGVATIAGMPFTSKNTTNHAFPNSVLFNLMAVTLTQPIQATINPNTTTISLGKLTTGSYDAFDQADFTDTSLIQVTGQYEISTVYGI